MALQQTTSLNSKVFESSSEWNIESFDEFKTHNVVKVSSSSVKFEDVYVSLELQLPEPLFDVHANSESRELELVLKDNEPLQSARKKSFRIKATVIS